MAHLQLGEAQQLQAERGGGGRVELGRQRAARLVRARARVRVRVGVRVRIRVSVRARIGDRDEVRGRDGIGIG